MATLQEEIEHLKKQIKEKDTKVQQKEDKFLEQNVPLDSITAFLKADKKRLNELQRELTELLRRLTVLIEKEKELTVLFEQERVSAANIPEITIPPPPKWEPGPGKLKMYLPRQGLDYPSQSSTSIIAPAQEFRDSMSQAILTILAGGPITNKDWNPIAIQGISGSGKTYSTTHLAQTTLRDLHDQHEGRLEVAYLYFEVAPFAPNDMKGVTGEKEKMQKDGLFAIGQRLANHYGTTFNVDKPDNVGSQFQALVNRILKASGSGALAIALHIDEPQFDLVNTQTLLRGTEMCHQSCNSAFIAPLLSGTSTGALADQFHGVTGVVTYESYLSTVSEFEEEANLEWMKLALQTAGLSAREAEATINDKPWVSNVAHYLDQWPRGFEYFATISAPYLSKSVSDENVKDILSLLKTKIQSRYRKLKGLFPTASDSNTLRKLVDYCLSPVTVKASAKINGISVEEAKAVGIVGTIRQGSEFCLTMPLPVLIEAVNELDTPKSDISVDVLWSLQQHETAMEELQMFSFMYTLQALKWSTSDIGRTMFSLRELRPGFAVDVLQDADLLDRTYVHIDMKVKRTAFQSHDDMSLSPPGQKAVDASFPVFEFPAPLSLEQQQYTFEEAKQHGECKIAYMQSKGTRWTQANKMSEEPLSKTARKMYELVPDFHSENPIALLEVMSNKRGMRKRWDGQTYPTKETRLNLSKFTSTKHNINARFITQEHLNSQMGRVLGTRFNHLKPPIGTRTLHTSSMQARHVSALQLLRFCCRFR